MEYLLTASKSWHLSQQLYGSQYNSVISSFLPKEVRIDDKNESLGKKRHSVEAPKCQFCELTFCDVQTLSHHIKYCKKKSVPKGTINSDQNKQKEKKSSLYECDICHVKFQTERALKRHQKVHSDERPYKCKKCDWSFKRMDHMKDHMLTHSGPGPHKCKICEKKFKRRVNMFQHIRSSHDCYICKNCDIIYHDEDNFKSHMLTHEIKCEECGKVFRDSFNYKEHLLTVHGNEKPFKCDVCSKAFARKRNLLTHTNIHTSEDQYSCSKCSKKFNNKSNLNRHVRSHCSVKAFKCEKCEKCFASSWTLARHREAHANREVYSCTIEGCHATFLNNKRFVRHMELHKTYKFKCELCNKMFYLKANLKKHMMVHNEQKPLKCPHCDSYFRVGSNLNVHLKVHHAKKNQYNCKICKMYFPNESMHEKHMRTKHDEEQSSKCNICDKLFTHRYISSHMQRIHGKRKHTHVDRTFSPKSRPRKKVVCDDNDSVENPDLRVENEENSNSSVEDCGGRDADNLRELNVNTRPRRRRHTDMPYKCIDCFKTFLQMSELIEHISNLHTDI